MNTGSNGKSRKRGRGTAIAAFFGFLVAVALVAGLVAPSLALGPPPAANHRFWGDVTLGLELAPADTVVSAKIGDLEWTTLVDDQGSYGLVDPFFYVPADDPETPEKDGGTPGDTITWWVNGVPANTTCPLCDDPAGPILFESMGHNRVDLNVSDVTYDLTANADPPEGGIVTGSGTYPDGSVVPVTATPTDECWYFINWTGDVADPDSAETTVSMDGDKTVTANFARHSYMLTVAANPPEGGTVSGGGTYDCRPDVQVAATPADECWYFVNWTGDVADADSAETTVSVDGDKTVTANFARHSCVLTVNANPPEGGTVTGGGTYGCGTQVRITATPENDRWYFANWTGDVADADSAETTVTMDGDMTVTANFAARTYEVALVSGWNLVSLPLIPNSANTEDIVAGIVDNVTCIWNYDNASGRWTFYAPGSPSDLNEMICGKGYWIMVSAPCTLIVEGAEPVLPFDIPLGSGWNLIGLPFIQEPQATEDVFAWIADDIESVWTYNERWAFYAPGAPSDLAEMDCGNGYWVKVTDSCTLTVEGS